MDHRTLLAILDDGQFHSGQEIADKLRVSRTAVWKRVNGLRSLGLPVDVVRGKGYRIGDGVELLDAEAIRRALSGSAAAAIAGLEVHLQIESTNTHLLDAPVPAEQALVCIAEYQSAGRGRRGRRWVSPLASNLYFSIGWQFQGGAEVLEGLSLAAGVAVCAALEEFDIDGLGLKWPNDVLRHGSKLAGILIEMTGDVSGPSRVVVGIGLNVAVPATAAELIDQGWSDLRNAAGDRPRRHEVQVALLNHLVPLLASYENAGFKAWREGWLELDVYANKPVTISSGSADPLYGIARGVDERGALLLETHAGQQTVHGGEVSLRPAS